MEDAGWRLRVEHADGPDELTAALQRRGWGAVLYGGDGPRAVPARKALALVRLPVPHVPIRAGAPYVHAGHHAAGRDPGESSSLAWGRFRHPESCALGGASEAPGVVG